MKKNLLLLLAICLVSISANAANWFSQGATNANNPANWNSLANGLGTPAIASDFTTAGHTWIVQSAMTMDGPWTIANNSNIEIQVGASLTPGSFTITLGGDWTNNGTFTAGFSTVFFNATSTGHTLNGDMTGSNAFFNLTFNSAIGSWSFGANPADVLGGLNIANTAVGGLTAPSTTLKIANNFIKSAGTFLHNNGTVELNGTIIQILPATATTFYNLNITNTADTIKAAAGAKTVEGTLTIASGAVLDMNTASSQLLGGFTAANSGILRTICTVNPAIPVSKTWGGLVHYYSTTTAMFVAAGNYNNLTITGTTGARTFTAGTINVSGDFSITGTTGARTFAGAVNVGGNFSLTSTTGVTALGGALDVNGNVTLAISAGNGTNIFNPGANTINVGGNWTVSTAGTGATLLNATGASTVIFDGTTPQTISKTSGSALVANFHNLQNSNTTSTLTVATSPSVTATTVANNFTNDASASFVCAGANAMTVGGNWANNGSFTSGTGTVTFNASTTGKTLTGNMTGSNKFNNLTFNNASGSWTFGANAADVGGTLNINATAVGGVTAPSTTLKVFFFFIKALTGTFVHNSGTVELNGIANQPLPASAITFNNLNITNTTGTVNASAAITVDGTLTVAASGTLNMGGHQLLGGFTAANSGELRTQSTANPAIPVGKTWGGLVQYNSTTTAMFVAQGNYNNLTVSGTTGARTFTAGTLTVSNDFTITGTTGARTFAGAVNVGGNFSLSSTSGVTALGGALDVDGNVTLSISSGNGTNIFNPGANTINVGGNWTVSTAGTGATLLNATGASTVVFDGTAPQTISKTGGANLVANFYNLQNSNTTSTLTVVTSPSVTATTMANDFTNDASATFVCAGANTITVGGNWTNNGTFTAGTGTVAFNAGDAGNTLNGSMTGSNAFNNLTFNNAIGAWSFGANAADVGAAFTITNGTVTAPSTTLKVAGAFAKTAGTFTHNSGTVEINGVTNQTLPATAITFHNLNVTNVTATVSAAAAITVDNTFTTSASSTTNMVTHQLLGGFTAAHSGELRTQNVTNPPIPLGKTWGGNVLYNGAGMFVSEGNYNHLTITGTTGTRTTTGTINVAGNFSLTSTSGITTLGGALTVVGNITINSTTTANIFDVSAGNHQITLGGNWTQSSSAATNPFNKRAGLVVINGTGVQTFSTSGGTSVPTFHHFQNSNTAATLTLGTAFSLSGNFTNDLGATTDCGANTVAITGNCTNDGTMTAATNPFTVTGNWSNSGTFTAGANTITIAGNWTNTGTFNANTSTVNLTAPGIGRTLNGDMTGSNKFNNLTFNNSAGAWTFGANPADVGGNLTITNTGLIGTGGVTGPSTTLKVAGDFVRTAGFFTHNGGTVEMNGTTDQGIALVGSNFNTLALNNTGGIVSLNAATTATADFTIPAGNTLACGAQTLTLGGNYTNNGTFTANTGTVAFTASDAGNTLNGSMTGSNAFNNLTFNNAAGAWSFGANAADVGAAFTITNGTVTAPSSTLKVAGAFAKTAGTFTHNSGTVEINGAANQTLPATAITFHNLNVNNVTATVSAAAAITVDNTFTTSASANFNMVTHQLLGGFTAAHSGTLQTQCTVNPAIPTGKTWGGLVQYNSTTTAMFVANGTYNNLTITGTTGARTFTGATTVNGNLSVGSAATTTGVTALGGNLIVAGNITIGSSTTANIFDVSASNYQISLGGNWTQSSSAATNPFNKRSGLVVINGTGVQTFSTSGGTSVPTLHHFQNSNTAATFTLGSTFTLSGNFTNDLGATTACGANTINIAGDWINNGTFTAGSGTVNFNATTTGRTISGNLTGTSKFNNLTFNSGTGAWSFGANAADVGGNLTITATAAGGVTAPSTTLKVAGNFVHTAGTFTHNSGIVELNGTTAQTIPGVTTTTFNTLDLNNTSDVITTNGPITINNAFTIPAGNHLSAGGVLVLTLGSSYTNNGTFTSGTGTVTFNSGTGGNTLSGDMTGSNKFNNLTFNNAAGGWSFGANAADVAGNFTITNGAVTAPSTTLKIAGNFAKAAGTFTHNSGTVEMNGTGAQTLPGGTATTFNTLTLNNTVGTITLNNATTINNDFTIPVSNTLACGAQTLSLGGNYTNSGTFTANTGTVSFIAGDAGNTLAGDMTGTNKFNNLTFNNAAGAWSFGANPADVGIAFTITNGAVTAPSTTLKVAGAFAKAASGTFTHNSGTVELNGTGAQAVPTSATTFNNLNVSNTGAIVTANAAITMDGTLTTTPTTTVNMATFQLLGAGTPAHSGVLRTQNTTNPAIPVGKTWGGLVQYNSTTTAMFVAQGDYNNLSIEGTSGARTFTAGITNVGGNLSITGTTGARTLGTEVNVTGDMNVTTTSGITSLGGPLTVEGNITINSTTTADRFDVTASNHQITLGGNWTQSSSAATNPFNKRSGTVVINGTGAQAITTSGGTSRPTFNNLTINNTTTPLELTQNIDVTGTMNVMTNATVNPLAAVQINNSAGSSVITGNGTILVTRTAATPDLATQYKFNTFTLDALTTNYNAAGDQIVNGVTYGTLITSGSGTKTAAGNLTVNDGLNVEAPTTLDMGTANRLIDATATYTVSGTLKTSVPTATSSSPIPSGVTWNGSGTVEYGALTGAQTVVSGVYNNLSLSNTSGTNDASGEITTNGVLTLGKVNIGTNNLILGNTATISGASGSNYIVATGAGRVRKGYTANGSFAFPIGDATNYSPVTLNVSGSGYSSAYAEANVTDAVHPDNANTNNFLTRYWSIGTSGITAQSYDATCTYIGADITGTEGLISGASYAGSLPWIKYGAAGSNTISATAISTSNTDISGITTAVPVVSVLPATSSTCTGSSINLDASGSTGDPTLTYSWSPSTGLSATTGATVTASPTTTGTVTSVYVYTVTVTDGNGFTATATATVSITPAPVAITGTLQVCEGATVTLGHPDAGGTWTSVTPAVATIDISTGEVTGVSSGNTTISYVPSVGCLATAVVTVNNQPSAISGTLTVCEFATTALGNTEPGGVWTSSAPSTASIGTSSGIVTGVNDGNATISYTLSGDCRVTAIVTVNPVPDTGTISGANNVNRGATTLLTEDVPGGVWSTSNGNASISLGGLVTGVSGGDVVISYGVTNGCGTLYATKSFRVNAITDAIYGPAIMCVGLESTFSHPFTGGTWSSSDTAILTVDETTGEATAVTSGVATISYFADMSFQTKSITVNTPIPAITGSPSVCLGTTLALSHASEGGIWSTTMGHVATVNSSTGVVTPVTSGVVFITYTLGTGCRTVRLFTINPLPGVISGSMIVCQGNTTTLSSSTFSGAWTSGTPAVATINVSSGLVTGISPGTTAITYTALTGCVRNAIVTVNAPLGSITGDPQVCVGNTNATLVAPTPGGTWSSSNVSVVTVHAITGLLTGIGSGTANITYTAGAGCITTTIATVSSVAVITGSDNMCAGSDITLSNATPGGVWSSSNTTVATVVAGTGVVTGVAGGTAHISYALTTGCYKTKLVTVNSLPNNINGTAILCSGNTTALTNATSGGTWSSSTPAIATIGTSGIVSGVSAGTSTISYTLSTGCRATRIVTVNTTPAVITGTGIMCAGNTTSLSSATPGGVWSSTNTSIATINSGTGLVSGVSGGTSTISYTIGACFRISVVTVTPLPATITGLLALCVGNTSTLLSATTGGTWVSSDVSKATIHSTTGVATGIGAGTSNITYTKTGCITTAVVTVSTVAAITGTAVLCPGNTTTLAHVTPGGTWSSANTARATVGSASGIVTGLSSGTVRISYILTGACAQSIVVTVNPLPNSISGTPIVCVGSTSTFSSTTGGGVWSSSTPAVATVSVGGVVTGADAGTSTITYQLATGCFATRVVTVSVAPGAITGTASVCVGSTTALSATPGGGVWSSSNITKATIDAGTGIATGVAAGTTFITYTIGSCRSTRVLTVLATPGAISGALLTCAGSTTQLASPTFAGAWSSTDVTKATIHPTTGLVSGVAIGTSTISYVVSGCARTAIVTVNAAVGAITGTPLVCVGQTIATLVGPGGGTWSSSNASIANVHSITAILTGVGAGNATITYRTSLGCYSTIVSTVNAAVSSITGTLSVCEGGAGSTTTLANATPGGTWASSNTLKATINSGTGEVTGVEGGSTTISYIVSTGCYKTTTFTVNVVPTPFDGTTTVQVGDTVHISSIAGGTWNSEHPLIATVAPGIPGVGIVTGVMVGAATISYTFPTGCLRTGVVTVIPARPGYPGPGKEQTGINSIYSLYPNPTSGTITINSPVRGMLVVYTIDGKQVAQYRLTNATTTVTLPKKLAAGMYMCKFTGDDNSTDIIRLQYQP